MPGKGYLNKTRREQMDHHVQTDKMAMHAGMRQQHHEGVPVAHIGADRASTLGALARMKSAAMRPAHTAPTAGAAHMQPGQSNAYGASVGGS